MKRRRPHPIHLLTALLASLALAPPAAGQTCSDLLFDVALSEGAVVDQQIFGRHCRPASSPSPDVADTLLILVHGITYHHDYWDFADPTNGTDRYSFAAAMHEAGYSTLSVDRIGIGQSSHPVSALVTIDSNAHTVHQVVQAVRAGAITDAEGGSYGRVILVGHSYGSWTTWFEATRYNDVDGVVLTGATHGLTTVDAPFGVASRLYPASTDPRFGPTSGLDPGYLTTRPGERYGAFYAPATADPAVIEHDEATKETVTNAEIQNYQLILAEPLDIRVPVLLTVGQADALFCGPAPGGADCSSEQALIDFERPFLGPNVPSIHAYILHAGGHDMNQMYNAGLYFDAVAAWLNGVLLAGPSCLEATATSVGSCNETVLAETQACYAATGEACPFDHPATQTALGALGAQVQSACSAPGSPAAAGFGAQMDGAALAWRAQESCLGNAASLAARAYGGPHAKVRNEALPTDQGCLDAAYDAGEALLNGVYDVYAPCVLGASCDPAALASAEAALETQAVADIQAGCAASGTTLVAALGTPADLFAARAVGQAHCLAAEGLGNGHGLPLRCGPGDTRLAGAEIRDASGQVVTTPLADLPRSTFFRVVLDSDVWGTRCGDGSDYAFGFRLAPEGSPVHEVLTEMAGGGVCVSHADCILRPQGLFSASFGPGVFSGYQADRPENPFRELTMVHQPYCTQDVHTGGGTVETGTPPEGGPLYRYGSINLRASMDVLRDILWAQMDGSDPQGYRPDRIRTIFSGTSAGGYGVLFNYHYPLDELRWVDTLGHNHVSIVIGGGAPDVQDLALAKEESWNLKPFLPPYCNDARTCIVSDAIVPAHAERLGAAPLQEFLSTSPQHDGTQENTQGFNRPPATDRFQWINGVRQHYCGQQELPHRFYFLPSNTDPVHGFVGSNGLFDPGQAATFDALKADGTDILTWLHGIFTDPDGAFDRVEEGELTTAVAGVEPFPCDVGDGPGGSPPVDNTPDPTSTVGCRVDGTPNEDGVRSCSYTADGAGVFEAATANRWDITVERDGDTVELAAGGGLFGCQVPSCPEDTRAGTILTRAGEVVTVSIYSAGRVAGTYGFVHAGGPAAVAGTGP